MISLMRNHLFPRTAGEDRSARLRSIASLATTSVILLGLFQALGCSLFSRGPKIVPPNRWEAYRDTVQLESGAQVGEATHGFRFYEAIVDADEEGNLRWEWNCTFTNTSQVLYGGPFVYVLIDAGGEEIATVNAYTARIPPGETRTVGGLATLEPSKAARVQNGRWRFECADRDYSIPCPVMGKN